MTTRAITDMPAKIPNPMGSTESDFPGRSNSVDVGATDSAAAVALTDWAASGAVTPDAEVRLVPRAIGPVGVVSCGASGAGVPEGSGLVVVAWVVLTTLLAEIVRLVVSVVTWTVVVAAAGGAGAGVASGIPVAAGVESVQVFSSRTRASPSGPTTGVSVMLHVSMTAPPAVTIDWVVWNEVGPLYGVSR